ncbi:hypothetical protein HY405_01620 [Candidatus Microgenomates bacterium]|nr:hypothetical protein [Candidatus Microgenomates bacterium]
MTKTNKKKNSLTNLILLALEKSIEAGELIIGSSQELKEWMYQVYNDYPKIIKHDSLSKAVRRLRERGLIEQEQREAGEIVLRLTQEGKNMTSFINDDDSEWDGRWRLVIFDVPETKRAVRDILRYRLRYWGFEPWQKSVWASKKNVTSKLRDYIKELGIEQWVLVIESDNV